MEKKLYWGGMIVFTLAVAVGVCLNIGAALV